MPRIGICVASLALSVLLCVVVDVDVVAVDGFAIAHKVAQRKNKLFMVDTI